MQQHTAKTMKVTVRVRVIKSTKTDRTKNERTAVNEMLPETTTGPRLKTTHTTSSALYVLFTRAVQQRQQ